MSKAKKLEWILFFLLLAADLVGGGWLIYVTMGDEPGIRVEVKAKE